MNQKKLGRPSDFSHELALEICHRIAEGQPLTKICRSPSMPCYRTVLGWLLKGEKKEPGFDSFLLMYERAKQDQSDTMADEMIEIADDSSNDTIEIEGKKGQMLKAENREWVNRSKLRVETRKWIAAKLKPRKYGDRMATELSGPNGGPVVIIDAGLNPYKNEAESLLIDANKS